jgi:uncharacterized repeat protein (TIGR02543 family)
LASRKWNNFGITYNLNGGTQQAGTWGCYIKGTAFPLPTAPIKTGHTFAGWYANADLTTGGAVTAISNTDTGNKEFWAKWTPDSYTVTWEADGGSPLPTQTSVNHGDSITAPAVMTKAGYTFGGWFMNNTFTTAAVFPIENVTGATTLYAKWTRQSTGGGSSITYYTVTFDTDGGNKVNSQSVAYNDRATKPADPTKEGYTFAGWYADKALTTEYNFNNSVTGNITVCAKWTEKTETPLGGGNTITTPEGQDPIDNGDGTHTLPGGGTITTPDGTDIAVPPGTMITDDGTTVTIPNGGTGGAVTYPDGRTEPIPAGSTVKISANGAGSSRPPEPGEWKNPFTDVKPGDWFYGDVEYVFTNGLMVGTSTDPMLFSPNATLTRGMVVTVLWRLAGSPVLDGAVNQFTDVMDGLWYSDAVMWAAANGIVSGYGNGLFGPEDNITREQMAVIIINYQKFSGKIPPDIVMDREFSDWNDISDWAKDAVNRLTIQGIISGKPGNLFDPQGETTRAEFAAVLHRFLEIVE